MTIDLFIDLKSRLAAALDGITLSRTGEAQPVPIDIKYGWLPMKRNMDKGEYPLIMIQPANSLSDLTSASNASDNLKLFVLVHNEDPVNGTFDLISINNKIESDLERNRKIGNKFRILKIAITYYDPEQNEYLATIELSIGSPQIAEESDLV